MITREEWLQSAVKELQYLFVEHSAIMPPVHVSVGFPSQRATSDKNKVIGECWYGESSADNKPHIFVSPLLSDQVQVLGVLVHECIHAMTPGAKHSGSFAKLAKSMGLIGKMTATTVGPELQVKLAAICSKIGDYPHAALKAGLKLKKQTTRMLLLSCSECGCKIRTTQKWVDEYVNFPCPCGATLVQGE